MFERKIDAGELSALSGELADFFRRAREDKPSTWFERQAVALRAASSDEDVEVLAAQIHRALQGGQGGPFGFVITDASGQIDGPAQVAYRETLNRTWKMTEHAFKAVTRRGIDVG